MDHYRPACPFLTSYWHKAENLPDMEAQSRLEPLSGDKISGSAARLDKLAGETWINQSLGQRGPSFIGFG